jgi:hypothetical protein
MKASFAVAFSFAPLRCVCRCRPGRLRWYNGFYLQPRGRTGGAISRQEKGFREDPLNSMAGVPMICSLIVGGRLTGAQIRLAELLLKNNPAEKTNAFCLFLYDISNSGKILEMLILGPKYSFMGPGCGKDKAAGHRQFVFNRQIAAGHRRKWFPCLPV